MHITRHTLPTLLTHPHTPLAQHTHTTTNSNLHSLNSHITLSVTMQMLSSLMGSSGGGGGTLSQLSSLSQYAGLLQVCVSLAACGCRDEHRMPL